MDDADRAMEYEERDIVAQGEYYTRHVRAMTGEGLHAKSAIAAELAHRDMEIDHLKSELSRGSAGSIPSFDEARNFVRQWLWESDKRKTLGQEWCFEHGADAANMIVDFYSRRN